MDYCGWGVNRLGYLSSWRDAQLVIEEHKEHPPLPICLEDAVYEVVDQDGDDEDVPKGHGTATEIASTEADAGADDAPRKIAVPTDDEYLAALDVCAKRAEASDDIAFLKQLMKRRMQSNLKRKADASPAGATLRKDLAAERIVELAR